MDYSRNWDVTASIILPISMCTLFGADYDGYEIIIFIVTYPNDIPERKSFKLCYRYIPPYNLDKSENLVSLLVQKEETDSSYEADWYTICWSEIKRHIRITTVNSKWMTNMGYYTDMKTKNEDIIIFCTTSI